MFTSESTITCPKCGGTKKETMPTDMCQYFYECSLCGEVLRPKHNDCCVYCSYGDVPCPSIQHKEGDAVAEKTNTPKRWGILLLFATIPTLLCCAFPILLVSLGMGSVVASLYGDKLPFLQWFGRNETITFGITASILLIAGWMLYHSGRTCPADQVLAQACKKADKWNLCFYWIAVAVYVIGFCSAYVYPHFLTS